MLRQRKIGFATEAAVPDALRALANLDLTGRDDVPGMIACHPVARGNPYQGLLYSRLPRSQVAPVAAYSLGDAYSIVEATSGVVRPIVHLHWLNVVTAGAEDAHDAMSRVDDATEVLDRIIDRGGLLMWTVHNTVPHDAPFVEADIEMRRRVVSRVGRVHVMTDQTPALVAPWFTLNPASTFTVAHPSYEGVYPSWMPREQARYELGIEADATTFLLLGRLAPYKGAAELIEAFGDLARERPGRVRLLIAGEPTHHPEVAALRELVMLDNNIVADLRKIPESEMQLYLRAADVAVLPYRRSLNSGVMHLALTFGLPVLLPASAGDAVEAAAAAWAHIYDDDEPEGLLEGLRASMDTLRDESVREAALDFAAARSPRVISDAFSGHIRTWLDEEGLS